MEFTVINSLPAHCLIRRLDATTTGQLYQISWSFAHDTTSPAPK